MKTQRFLFALILMIATTTGVAAQKISREAKAEADSIMSLAISHAKSVLWAYAGENGIEIKRAPNTGEGALITYDGAGGLDVMTKERELFIGDVYVELLHNPIMVQANPTLGGHLIPAGSRYVFIPKNGSTIGIGDDEFIYDIDSLEFNFETGKYYTIRSVIDKDNKIEFSLKETSTVEYTDFMKANPEHLGKRWFGESKTIQGRFSHRIIFTGNRMRFEGSVPARKDLVLEGPFIYNENSIILFPDTATNKGKNIKMFDGTALVWYYTVTDGELYIDDGLGSLVGSLGINGTYIQE